MSDEHFGLVMPFVNVTSVGGELDDLAFACGWDCGDLYHEMEQLRRAGKVPEPRWIKPENMLQFDLIAMEHGLTMNITVDGNNTYLWAEFKGDGRSE